MQLNQNLSGSVLLLTFWPAVEDDDKKVGVMLGEPFDTQTSLSILFVILYQGFSWSLLLYNTYDHLLFSGSWHYSGSHISFTWAFSCRI